MWPSILAIFCGAGLGALLRAGFNLVTVSVALTLPLGTFISNMVGGYFIGIAVAFLAIIKASPPNGSYSSLQVFWVALLPSPAFLLKWSVLCSVAK